MSVCLRLLNSLLSMSVIPDGSRLLENLRLSDNEMHLGETALYPHGAGGLREEAFDQH